MDFRTRRQLTVLALILLVVGGVGFLAFRVALPEASCEDNRRNQGEEGVDCGGPCVSCALRQSKPIEVFWARFVKVRENTYDVAAEIRNPNIKLGASAFDFEFKLFDAEGVNVASRSGRSFLYPGETAHLAEVGFVSGRVIRNVALVVGNVEWVLTDAIGPDIIAGSREYAVGGDPGNTVSMVRAIVSNRSITDLSGVGVAALALDRDGNLLGVHRTVIDALPAGTARPLEFTWPREFAVPPATLTVEARSPAALPASRR